MMNEAERTEFQQELEKRLGVRINYRPADQLFFLYQRNGLDLSIRETNGSICFFGRDFRIMRRWASDVVGRFVNENLNQWEFRQNEIRGNGERGAWFNLRAPWGNNNNWHGNGANRSTVINVAVSLYNKINEEGVFSDNYNAQNYIIINDQPEGKPMSNLTETIRQLLSSNLQVILTGAPGTGKTYTAKQVAKELVCEGLEGTDEDTQKASIDSCTRFVQFHPGYDYSDFVIGMKPILVSEDGKEVFKDENGKLYTTYNNDPNAPKTPFSGATSVSYAWKDGVFKKFADEAKKAYDAAADKAQAQKYVFLIDEINRADLSRVFGELFSLLEEDYRYPKNKNGIRLPNGENFVIPENLYIIGTMNDIDRSVESMDFALRRRFAWYEISAESSAVILDDKAKEGKIVQGDVVTLKNAMKRLNDTIAPPSTDRDETADSGQGSDKKPDLRLGSAYQLGGAIFAKLEKYVKVDNGKPSEAENDAFISLWNNHIKNILSEYLRGRRDRDDLLEELENEFKNAVSGVASKPKSNSISSDGESRAQANLEQATQA